MTDADLITLAEREAQRLGDENDHGAAIIMRALIERVRCKLVRFDFTPGSVRMHTGGMVSEPASVGASTMPEGTTVTLDTKSNSLSNDEMQKMVSEVVRRGLAAYDSRIKRNL